MADVTLFVPCFVDTIYPRVGQAVVELLERLGQSVEFIGEPACCGQPAFNTGYWDEARKVASRMLDTHRNAKAVVIPSGSCCAMVRVFYPELFAGTDREAEANDLAHRTFEFSEYLLEKLKLEDVGATFNAKVTLHDGCHGLRELGLKDTARKLLKHVKGLELVELEDRESCCGFGGTFAVKFPMISSAMGDAKVKFAQATQAEYLVSNDSSCLMHLQGLINHRKATLKTIHLAEVLNSR